MMHIMHRHVCGTPGNGYGTYDYEINESGGDIFEGKRGGVGWIGGSVGYSSETKTYYACGGTGYVMGHPSDDSGNPNDSYYSTYFNGNKALIKQITNAVTNGKTGTIRYTDTSIYKPTRIMLKITALPTETGSSVKYYNGTSWENCSAKRYNGTSWEDIKFKQYNGSNWI